MSSKSLDLSWFSDPKDESQLKQLSEAIDSVAGRQLLTAAEFQQLFSVFERFPDDDGFESFWHILHCLESFRGYEQFLVRSVRRKPCHFNLTMVNRLLNSGVAEVHGEPLVEMLADVARASTDNPEAASQASDFLKYQERRRNGA